MRRRMKAFALDPTASDAARLTGISTRSINTILLEMRQRIAGYCEARSPCSGEVDLDESYLGPDRVRDKRGRCAGSKIIEPGIFKHNGHPSTGIVPEAKKKT